MPSTGARALVAQLRERPRGDQLTSGALFSELAARQAVHLVLERQRLDFAIALLAESGGGDGDAAAAAAPAERSATPLARGRLTPPPLAMSTFPRPTSFSSLPPPAAVVALAGSSPCACAAGAGGCDGRCGGAPRPQPPDELVLALVAAHQAEMIDVLRAQLAALRAALAPAWAQLVCVDDGGDGDARDGRGVSCALRSAEPVCAVRGAQLAVLLALNPRVRRLDLSHAPVCAPSASRLVSTFESCAIALAALHLDGCALGAEGAAHVAADLARPGCALRALSLRANAIGDAGALALGRALERNGSVTRCNLSSNKIGDGGARALARAIGEAAGGVLAHLDLSGNAIGASGATALAFALSAHLRAGGPLRTLALARNAPMSADAAILLARAAMAPVEGGGAEGRARAPVHVRLHGLGGYGDGNDGDGDDGDVDGGGERSGGSGGDEATFTMRSSRDAELTLVTHDLHFDPTLRGLRLCSLRLTDAAALRVAGALRANRSLLSLDLMANALRNAAATALGAALRVNATLRALNLCNNAIGDDGAAALAAALCRNSTLRSLNLARNRLTDGCAPPFADALGGNRVLRALHLDGNVLLGEHGKATIRTAWRAGSAARAAEGTLQV
jgi:Ran GTPase-activating protein (RanGAP) involved in mRNA processing and transport